MTKMGSVDEVSRLLNVWDQEQSAGRDVIPTLTRLAEIFESETEAFLKQDPDPFDDRHPSRLQPDCTLGHMLKTVFRNERIVDEMVKVYCQRDDLELNTVVCRFLLDILPGLESVIFQEEGFVPKLLDWAESAPNPLQSYATGLLAAAMDVPEIAANHREKNAYFVPLMLRRLHSLGMSYLQNVQTVSEFCERPFAHLGSKYDEKISSEDNHKSCKRIPRKRKDSSKSPRYNPISSRSEKKKSKMKTSSPINQNILNDGSNSNWIELEQYMIGSYQVYPMTLATQQRYILQYLTPMGEYQDLIGHIFEENALPLILRYIDLHQNSDVRLAFEALKYLASLLCHKKIVIEFLNIGGLQLLLKVPHPSIAATGVSICLYYLAYIEEAMEKICLLPSSVVSDLVSYALWLLECSHDSSRCHATMFFGFAFAFRIILEHFDEQDGLRKLFNVMSTLDVFVLQSTRTLSDDQIFANRQTTRHVCGALKRYFEAQLAAEVSCLQKQDPTTSECSFRTSKAVNLTSEMVEQNMETLHELSITPMFHWKPVNEFLHLDGVSFLLELISGYFELSYSGRAETVKNALDVLKICSLTSATQLRFCEKISSPEYLHVTGISVLLQAVEGELMPVADIMRSALHTIINCVCSKIPAVDNCSRSCSVPKKKRFQNVEDVLNKIWKCVRIKNGIIILINLLFIKTPLTDADSIRALACKALCGLARSQTVKQIISKLPLVTGGQLLDLMKQPVLQDKYNDHVQFCKYGLELIERVTGAPVAAGSESSMLNINKSEVVAKTKVTYQENQLLQLIFEHLSQKGFNETAACLQKEMAEKSLVTTSAFPSVITSPIVCRPTVKTFQDMDIYKYNTPSSSSPSITTIPPPSVPLKIVLNKKTQNTPSRMPSCRLQKPQTCSGNYLQSPAMRRQGTSTKNYIAPYRESHSSISLDSIIHEYLRKQHALCKNPMLACPSFDLFIPHKCPEPHYKMNAPVNCALRMQKREVCFPGGGYGAAALNNKHIYSKFRFVRAIRDEEGRLNFTTCSFLNCNPSTPHARILVGTLNGFVKIYNANTAEEELSKECHFRGVAHIESRKSSSLLITSDGGRVGHSSLWNFTDNFDLLHNFQEIQHMEFGKRSLERMVGTKNDAAAIFDTATYTELENFPSEDLGNNYAKNRATFDYYDELILSDGLLWDVRSATIVHKLDKINATFNGVFHPSGREIISNSEIWDLRTFKLLRTVSGLDQCRVTFNSTGSVIYGVSCNKDIKMSDDKLCCFYTYDAYDYNSIATIDVKRPVFQVSADLNDRYIATIENQVLLQTDPFLAPLPGVECVCRLYEVGRTKEEGDNEDGEESEDSEEESEEDEEVDEEDNEGQGNDVTFDLEEGDDVNWITTSDSSDDEEALFSLNTSMED